MNPGAAEEAGKIASGFMEAMKSQPLALALVIMNMALLGFFWFILEKVAENHRNDMKLIFDEQKEVRELLTRCIAPKASSRDRLVGEGELS